MANFVFYRTEKNASGWSHGKLKKLLVGLKFSGPEGNMKQLSTTDYNSSCGTFLLGTCETAKVVTIQGEATAKYVYVTANWGRFILSMGEHTTVLLL